ncbi:hypothetical protein AcW1_004157 [Taiwanofungus camphoratus]|nr:hypothetical protein AcW2_006832 [Antrodia cinnamomea]KAI0951926.1 hypothetical protein AcV7_007880 [Antrodia cinnamomea]KAI0959297.1 hypothetical protein AcW1_004157 [Antrodia cinnamomea]
MKRAFYLPIQALQLTSITHLRLSSIAHLLAIAAADRGLQPVKAHASGTRICDAEQAFKRGRIHRWVLLALGCYCLPPARGLGQHVLRRKKIGSSIGVQRTEWRNHELGFCNRGIGRTCEMGPTKR